MKTDNKIGRTKWEVVYEDDYIVSTWRYDIKKNGNNPYEIEIKHKKEPVIEKKTRTRTTKKG